MTFSHTSTVSSTTVPTAWHLTGTAPIICSLEILDDNGNLLRKADMFSKRTIKQHKTITSVSTASEALTVSIGEHAKVDLPFMAKLTGKTEDTLIRELQGVIYKDPATSIYQTADEYLSGNVRRKLRLAKKAAEQDNTCQINVEALRAALPKDLDASEIEVRLGLHGLINPISSSLWLRR